MADSLVAGWLSEIGLESVIATFREVAMSGVYCAKRVLAVSCVHHRSLLLRVCSVLQQEEQHQAAIRRLSLRPVLKFGTSLQEGIDSEALAALDDAQLKELGIKRMGDRTKVLPLLFYPSNLTRVFTASSLVHGIVELTLRAVCTATGKSNGYRAASPIYQPAWTPAKLSAAARKSGQWRRWKHPRASASAQTDVSCFHFAQWCTRTAATGAHDSR